jgi:hypothetical protein
MRFLVPDFPVNIMASQFDTVEAISIFNDLLQLVIVFIYDKIKPKMAAE